MSPADGERLANWLGLHIRHKRDGRFELLLVDGTGMTPGRGPWTWPEIEQHLITLRGIAIGGSASGLCGGWPVDLPPSDDIPEWVKRGLS